MLGVQGGVLEEVQEKDDIEERNGVEAGRTPAEYEKREGRLCGASETLMGLSTGGPPLTLVEASVLKPGQITGWGQVKEGSGKSRFWNSSLREDVMPGESKLC